ncbi:MAG: hypothetical protein PHR30_11100 [Gallionellaceae bacterium]|nr:hypothetical protein [Gallionellaceae bacterium]
MPTDTTNTPTTDRRVNGRLRAVYDDAAEHLHQLFGAHDDWAGSSIDYVALRMVHERYADLTPGEVRVLVTSIGSRVQHCVSQNRLTALYP